MSCAEGAQAEQEEESEKGQHVEGPRQECGYCDHSGAAMDDRHQCQSPPAGSLLGSQHRRNGAQLTCLQFAHPELVLLAWTLFSAVSGDCR